jgi:hypothetical protein
MQWIFQNGGARHTRGAQLFAPLFYTFLHFKRRFYTLEDLKWDDF